MGRWSHLFFDPADPRLVDPELPSHVRELRIGELRRFKWFRISWRLAFWTAVLVLVVIHVVKLFQLLSHIPE